MSQNVTRFVIQTIWVDTYKLPSNANIDLNTCMHLKNHQMWNLSFHCFDFLVFICFVFLLISSQFIHYCKSSMKPPNFLFNFRPHERGLIRDGWGLFQIFKYLTLKQFVAKTQTLLTYLLKL